MLWVVGDPGMWSHICLHDVVFKQESGVALAVSWHSRGGAMLQLAWSHFLLLRGVSQSEESAVSSLEQQVL